MANETKMRVVTPTVPPGFCLSVAGIIGLFKQLQVFFPGVYAVFNIGPDEPTIENRDKEWHKTDPTTGIMVGIFNWAPTLGIWAKNHWNNGILPTYGRVWFAGPASAIDTFDGGESGTLSSSTGPFWEIDTDWNDKIPIGVGTAYTPAGTDYLLFTVGVAIPTVRTGYFLKPTGRLYDRA